MIHREWYERGVLTGRRDIGRQGHAIRRTSYTDGKIAVREYYNRDDILLSRELFDLEGYITDWILYRTDGSEQNRWCYDRGTPVRQVHGGIEYVKRGDRFGYFNENGEFIDTPRGSLSR